MPLADYVTCKRSDPSTVIFLKIFAWLAFAGCLVGLVYTVLMLAAPADMGMKHHGIDQWGDNSLKWVSSKTDGFYAWKYAISILSALLSVVKTTYEFLESICLANKISDAYSGADDMSSHDREYYQGNGEKMQNSHLWIGIGLLLLLALTNAMPIYDVGFKTLMFGVKVAMFVTSVWHATKYIHVHGFPSIKMCLGWTVNKLSWGTLWKDYRDHAGHADHADHHSKHPSPAHHAVGHSQTDSPAHEPLNPSPRSGESSSASAGPDEPSKNSAEPESEYFPVTEGRNRTPTMFTVDNTKAGGDYYCPSAETRSSSDPGRPPVAIARRLASFDASSVLSTLIVTAVSILVWYLFLRDPASPTKPRRRTTITKKRPTFVKGKRRASRKPTLSTLRSESTLLN